MRRAAAIVVLYSLNSGCGGTGPGLSAGIDIDNGDAGRAIETTTPPGEAAADAGAAHDSGPATAVRLACTNTFGQALTTTFGRLDGHLVSVVSLGHKGCHGDTSHVHLQVRVHDATYDVAVTMISDQSMSNPDVAVAEKVAPLVNGPWAEGWHPGTRLDYVADLGLHATDFAVTAERTLAQKVESLLSTTDAISVYATGYGPDGIHKVHRNFGGSDGALVLDPTSPTPRFVAFHFSTQNF